MKGFSLIELLVVVAILATLTVMVIPRFSQYSKTQTLKDAAQNLQSNLRLAQNKATAGVRCGTEAATSWQVLFDNSDKSYTISCNGSLSSTTYKLPDIIEIESISADLCDTDFNLGSFPSVSFDNISGVINFQPIPFGCLSSRVSKMVITLQAINDPLSRKEIAIEKGGAILISE